MYYIYSYTPDVEDTVAKFYDVENGWGPQAQLKNYFKTETGALNFLINLQLDKKRIYKIGKVVVGTDFYYVSPTSRGEA